MGPCMPHPHFLSHCKGLLCCTSVFPSGTFSCMKPCCLTGSSAYTELVCCYCSGFLGAESVVGKGNHFTTAFWCIQAHFPGDVALKLLGLPVLFSLGT